MIHASTSWQARIKDDSRKTISVVICELCQQLQGYPFATASASSEYDSNHAASQVVDGRIREVDYEGGNYLPMELWGKHPGWWSLNTSDGSGALATPEVVTIHYLAQIKIRNFFVVAPASNYPVDFTIEVSSDGVTWETISTVTDNSLCLFALRESQDRIIEWVRVSITKISAVNSPVKLLQAGAVTTVVFELYDNDVMVFTEELGIPSGASPLSLVSSNWIEFSIANEGKLTDQDNTSSFFYGLLGKNFRFRPYIGLRVWPAKEWGSPFPGLPVYYWTSGDDRYEFMPLGVFWNRATDMSTTEIVTHFMGYDLLSIIKDLKPPILSVLYDTTVYELFDLLFKGLGFVPGSYWIDKTLDQPIAEGFFAGKVGENFSGETVGEVLQVLSEAGCCYVNCNRIGQIVVRSNFLNGTPVDTLTDDDFIKSITKRKDISDLYDAVRVRYHKPMGMGDEEVLYSSEIVIPVGGGEDLEVEFPDPVGLITRVELQNTTSAEVSKIYPGAVRSLIEFSNAGPGSDTVTVNIYGKKLKFFNTSIDRTNLNETIEDVTKTLKVSNWLIQSQEVAQIYGESLLQYCSESVNRFDIAERGDPRREVGDLIAIDDATNEIEENIQITKQKFTWDGVLSSSMEGRIAIVENEWCYVTPFHTQQVAINRERVEQESWVSPVLLAEEIV